MRKMIKNKNICAAYPAQHCLFVKLLVQQLEWSRGSMETVMQGLIQTQ
jgi:hypothetical protein